VVTMAFVMVMRMLVSHCYFYGTRIHRGQDRLQWLNILAIEYAAPAANPPITVV